jgi:hypothetical protein
MRHLLLAALLVLAASTAVAQDKERLSSNDLEVRTFLGFKAPDAVVQKNLPPGWELNSPAAGPSKGFNLGLTLINQTVTQGPDGKALPARTYIAFFALLRAVDLSSCILTTCPAPPPSERSREGGARRRGDRMSPNVRQYSLEHGWIGYREKRR